MRLRRLQQEFGEAVTVCHRSFVLIAEDRSDRTFKDYHRDHRHAASTQDSDSPPFRIPAAGERYPRGSLPALEAAAWVRQEQPNLFPAFDLALFEAFFGRTEDISDPETLARIAASVGADPDGVREALASARFRQLVLDEHHEAAGRGIRSVPTVLIPGRPAVVGAVPYPDLREAVAAGCSGESRGGTSEGS